MNALPATIEPTPEPVLTPPVRPAPWTPPSNRSEVMLLVALSVGAHLLLAARLVRARPAEPPPRQQTVNIEIVAPPPPVQPVVVPPQAAQARRPRPVTRARPAAARPAAPIATESPPPEEPEALPEGDDGPPAPVAVAAPAPVAAAPPAPVQAAHEGANYLKNPRPPYPALALRQGWQGQVMVRVRVGPDGRAAAVSVERSSGRETLDRAALEAVQGWLFVPARQGGNAIAGWVTVPIVFRLQ